MLLNIKVKELLWESWHESREYSAAAHISICSQCSWQYCQLCWLYFEQFAWDQVAGKQLKVTKRQAYIYYTRTKQDIYRAAKQQTKTESLK